MITRERTVSSSQRSPRMPQNVNDPVGEVVLLTLEPVAPDKEGERRSIFSLNAKPTSSMSHVKLFEGEILVVKTCFIVLCGARAYLLPRQMPDQHVEQIP